MFQLFKRKPKKTTTDVSFQNAVCEGQGSVRTQDGEWPADSWMAVRGCVEDMLDDAEQFVVLTLAEIHYGVRYVQACRQDDGIFVELGLEKGQKTRLVHKSCSEEECLEIFYEFYTTTAVHQLETYRPSEFFVE